MGHKAPQNHVVFFPLLTQLSFVINVYDYIAKNIKKEIQPDKT